MDAPERALEVLDEAVERKPQRGPPSDQHIIMPRLHSMA
jgi:hypothetical protein